MILENLRAARIALPLALALPVSAAAPHAAAQATLDRKQALAEFKRAQKMYDEGRFKDALPAFERVAESTDSPNAWLYVARCYRSLGRLPSAYEAMTKTMRSADRRAEKEDRYLETRDAAAAERAALESKVARIVVAAADPPSGMVVRLNGDELDPARMGEIIAVEPGEIKVTATAPGRSDFERVVTVDAGDDESVAIVFGMPAKGSGDRGPAHDAEAGAGARGAPPEAEPTGGGLRTAGFVALGVGVAGMATFATAGMMANSRFDSLDEECGGPCPESKRSDVEGGRRLDLVANVGLGVGAVGLLAGGAMVLFGGPSDTPQGDVAVAALPGGGGLRLRGRF